MDVSEPTVTNSCRSTERGLKMVCGAFYIPKEKHLKPQGDDAHFICAEKQVIGVADGVGGWSKSGVDAGQYARHLMTNSVNAIQNVSKGDVDPKKVMDEAYSNTKVEGSSTACILALKNKHLHVANVGDSGFVLIREGEQVYKSAIQQHHFNCPYQLGKKKSGGDEPMVAQVYKVKIKSGDIIVVGTDGLFDNIYANNIQDIARMMINTGAEPEQVAWAIAEHAYYNSVDKSAETPFAWAKAQHASYKSVNQSVGISFAEASLMTGRQHLGGKADDITVIVACIVDE